VKKFTSYLKPEGREYFQNHIAKITEPDYNTRVGKVRTNSEFTD